MVSFSKQLTIISAVITNMTFAAPLSSQSSRSAGLARRVARSLVFDGRSENQGHSLYNVNHETKRSRRSVDDLDMCSYRMQNITTLADVAGQVFVSKLIVIFTRLILLNRQTYS